MMGNEIEDDFSTHLTGFRLRFIGDHTTHEALTVIGVCVLNRALAEKAIRQMDGQVCVPDDPKQRLLIVKYAGALQLPAHTPKLFKCFHTI